MGNTHTRMSHNDDGWCFVSPPTNMWLSVTIIQFRVIVQSAWDRLVICVCHLYPHYLSAVGYNKRGRQWGKGGEVFLCNENSPSLCLSLVLSRSLCLASSCCQPQSERRGAWQADWLLAAGLGSCRSFVSQLVWSWICFPYLTLLSSPSVSLYLLPFTVTYTLTICEQNTLQTLQISYEKKSSLIHLIGYTISEHLHITKTENNNYLALYLEKSN